MSRRNKVGKQRGREEALRENRRRARLARRRRIAALAGIPAFLAVVTALGVWALYSGEEPYNALKDAPVGAVGSGRLAIGVGPDAAPSALDVWEDPRCPSCKKFEADYGGTVRTLVRDGKLKVRYHPVSFLDRHDDGSGSRNGANAMACAQNAGRFLDFHDLMYANQPDERHDVWADNRKLIALSKQVPGLDTPAFEKCVTARAQSHWASAVQAKFDKDGFKGTPTVLLNGAQVFPDYHGTKATPELLASWVGAADAGKPPAPAAPGH